MHNFNWQLDKLENPAQAMKILLLTVKSSIDSAFRVHVHQQYNDNGTGRGENEKFLVDDRKKLCHVAH